MIACAKGKKHSSLSDHLKPRLNSESHEWQKESLRIPFLLSHMRMWSENGWRVLLFFFIHIWYSWLKNDKYSAGAVCTNLCDIHINVLIEVIGSGMHKYTL